MQTAATADGRAAWRVPLTRDRVVAETAAACALTCMGEKTECETSVTRSGVGKTGENVQNVYVYRAARVCCGGGQDAALDDPTVTERLTVLNGGAAARGS